MQLQQFNYFMAAKKEKSGKKKHINKKTSQKWKHYKIEGETIKKDRECPRCGPGVFLAKPKLGDRLFCGKCQYTEFISKNK